MKPKVWPENMSLVTLGRTDFLRFCPCLYYNAVPGYVKQGIGRLLFGKVRSHLFCKVVQSEKSTLRGGKNRLTLFNKYKRHERKE